MEDASLMILAAVVTEYLSLSKLVRFLFRRDLGAKPFSDCMEKLHLGFDNQSDSYGPVLR